MNRLNYSGGCDWAWGCDKRALRERERKQGAEGPRSASLRWLIPRLRPRRCSASAAGLMAAWQEEAGGGGRSDAAQPGRSPRQDGPDPGLLPPSRTSTWVWSCNEAAAAAFTSSDWNAGSEKLTLLRSRPCLCLYYFPLHLM